MAGPAFLRQHYAAECFQIHLMRAQGVRYLHDPPVAPRAPLPALAFKCVHPNGDLCVGFNHLQEGRIHCLLELGHTCSLAGSSTCNTLSSNQSPPRVVGHAQTSKYLSQLLGALRRICGDGSIQQSPPGSLGRLQCYVKL